MDTSLDNSTQPSNNSPPEGPERRSHRQSIRTRLTDFIYTPKGNSALIKRKAKAAKRKEMKANEEILYADYGDNYSKFETAPSELTPIDLQFYTPRAEDWVRIAMDYLGQQFKQDNIPDTPTLTTKSNGKQIKVRHPHQEENTHYVTIFVYNTGTVLIQGAECVEWCRANFSVLKKTLDEGRKVATDLPIERSPVQNHPRCPVTPHHDYITADKLRVTLPDKPSHSVESSEYLDESRHLTLLNESAEDSILPHMELLDHMSEEQLSQELTPEETVKPYKIQIQAQKDLIVDIHKQVKILSMCLEAKIAEADNLRQARNQEKVLNKEIMDKLQADLTAANLELEEYREKEKEIKVTKNLVVRQKREINRIKMSYDQLIKNKTELEKSLLKSSIPTITPENQHQHQQIIPHQDIEQGTQGGGQWNKIAAKQGQRPAVKVIVKDTVNGPAKTTKFDHDFPPLPNIQRISVIVNGKTRNQSKPHKIQIATIGGARIEEPHRIPKLFIAGDSNVRGLSDLVNPTLMTREVAVRGGARIQDAATKVPIDASRLEQGSIMIYNFGTNDLENPDYKKHITNLMDTLKQKAKHLTVGITSVPEQAERTLNERSKNINHTLEQACRDCNNIKLIKSRYQMSDFTRNGMFLNNEGRGKLADSINKFVNCQKNYV